MFKKYVSILGTVLRWLLDGKNLVTTSPSHSPNCDPEITQTQNRVKELEKKLSDNKTKETQELTTMKQEVEKLRKTIIDLKEPSKYYPRQIYQNSKSWGTFNIGVTGDSGTGKSTLVNSLRGLGPQDAGAAKIGVGETTMEPNPYSFMETRDAVLWDLPGCGTPNFPQKTYLKTIGLRYFDAVLVVTASRFTEDDKILMNELKSHKVPYLAIRNKVNIDVSNGKEDFNREKDITLKEIRKDMQKNGVKDAYLINGKKLINEYQGRKMMVDLLKMILNDRMVAQKIKEKLFSHLSKLVAKI